MRTHLWKNFIFLLCFFEMFCLVTMTVFLVNVSLPFHHSRKKSMGLKAALNDEGLAEGWLFWDDGKSISE